MPNQWTTMALKGAPRPRPGGRPSPSTEEGPSSSRRELRDLFEDVSEEVVSAARSRVDPIHDCRPYHRVVRREPCPGIGVALEPPARAAVNLDRAPARDDVEELLVDAALSQAVEAPVEPLEEVGDVLVGALHRR